MAGKVHTKRFGIREFVPARAGADIPGVRGFDDWVANLKQDPARLAAVMVDLRRPKGVDARRFGVSAYASCREPMLNADKMAIERSLSKHFDELGSRHAKLKMVKVIEVKPQSGPAARINGSWAQSRWEVWSLKYSPGVILRNHRGDESSVFPGWGKLKGVLEELGFTIVR